MRWNARSGYLLNFKETNEVELRNQLLIIIEQLFLFLVKRRVNFYFNVKNLIEFITFWYRYAHIFKKKVR